MEFATPDLSGLQTVISDLRGASYAAAWGKFWPGRSEDFTEDVQGDIAHGIALTGAQLAAATSLRAEYFRRATAFFERFDVLLCPATQVMPFPLEDGWPKAIDDTSCRTYTDWIAITYAWSLIGCPAIVVPVGQRDGVPFALQIVGRPHSERRLLEVAAWVEGCFGGHSLAPSLDSA